MKQHRKNTKVFSESHLWKRMITKWNKRAYSCFLFVTQLKCELRDCNYCPILPNRLKQMLYIINIWCKLSAEIWEQLISLSSFQDSLQSAAKHVVKFNKFGFDSTLNALLDWQLGKDNF